MAASRIDPVRDPVLAADNLLPALTLGPNARREGERIVVPEGAGGHAAFGPHWPIRTGDYIATFRIEAPALWALRKRPVVTIEVVEGDVFFAQRAIPGRDIEAGIFDLRFRIDAPPQGRPVEFRIWSHGAVSAEIVSLAVRRAD